MPAAKSPPLHWRSWVEIDGAALRSNYAAIRRGIPQETTVLGVVKANAYGHGVLPIARELIHCGARMLGVANLGEAQALRTAGIREPILLLSAALPSEYEEAIAQGCVFTLSSIDEARLLAKAARRRRAVAEVHVKVDTGMGRLGIWHEDAPDRLSEILRGPIPGLKVSGLCTHFASADDDAPMTRVQWRGFQALRRFFPGLMTHAANSPAIFRRVGESLDMVRPGIAMYGAMELPGRQEKLGLTPLLTWKSRVTLVRDVPPGRTLSYGATYRTTRRERIATIACGYADGYHRILSNRGVVLVNGVRCPIRGRVTMDQILVDTTRAGVVAPGTEVVLIGRQGRQEISAVELANLAGTISYEVFTSIGSRVQRLYRGFRAG